MDIVYILGKGSPRNDLELLFSLRSVKKYMTDLGKVFIIGEKPTWLKNVVHIPCPDPYEKHWQNAHYKIRKACEQEALSSDFLLMNDDFFMLREFSGFNYPAYSRQDMDGGCNGPYSFAVHAPMKMNKSLYLQMPLDLKQNGTWSPRSLYGNFFKCEPIFTKDFNINVNHPKLDIHSQILGKPLISTGHDAILNNDFCVLLESYFPEPSEFEDLDVLGYPHMPLFPYTA
jgi:hypothetical protein